MRVAIAFCAMLAGAVPADAATVAGRAELRVPGLALADVGPVVVYLEGRGPVAAPPQVSAPRIHQHAARFDPEFLAVALGESVEMVNDDGIFHNVFSFSAPNDFDLGLYASGRSRSVRFEHPGPVRIYCSIHEDMAGTIFVSPTRWFAKATPDGTFEIDSVPPGTYVLRTWSPTLPSTATPVEVEAGDNHVDVEIAASGAGSAEPGSGPGAE